VPAPLLASVGKPRCSFSQDATGHASGCTSAAAFRARQGLPAGEDEGVANQHFANLGDVWKHLWLTAVVGDLRPGQYVETHAGSALYQLADDAERALGVRTFLALSGEDDLLRSNPYRRQLAEFVVGPEPSYPGSPMLAMMLLGRACRYVFCDTDRASVDDLLATRDRLGLHDRVQVVHGDGLAETLALLETRAIGQASLVHVDPFDFREPGPGGASARDLVVRLAAAAIPTFVWYGLATSADSLELLHEITTAAPEARAWCAELHVGGPRANLVGIGGSGCGILLAGIAPPPGTRQAAEAFVAAFNDLTADTDLQVSIEPVFATST
jgi:23S rRNA A2030 N6-methylase RlmJ